MSNAYYLDTPNEPVTGLKKTESGEYRFLTETGRDKAHFHLLPKGKQQMVLRWLRWNLIDAQEANHNHSSAEMNWILFDRTGQKLTENEFREAMMHLSFDPENAGKREWYFHVDEQSPMFTIQRDGKRGLPLLGSPVIVDANNPGYALPDDGRSDYDGMY